MGKFYPPFPKNRCIIGHGIIRLFSQSVGRETARQGYNFDNDIPGGPEKVPTLKFYSIDSLRQI